MPKFWMLAAALALLSSPESRAQTPPYKVTEKRERCAHYDPLRQPFFGDTHAHTTFSVDAGIQRTRNTPDDAYRYAKGEVVGLQPYDAAGRPMRRTRIDRPLDFVALSDHSEGLGMVGVCTTPGYEGYKSFMCRAYRRYPRLAFFLFIRMPTGSRRLADEDARFAFLRAQTSPSRGLPKSICGEDSIDCEEAGRNRWQEIQQAAERAYDRSSRCGFTSFIGYEWTGNSAVNLHRNVIFRNERVTDHAISFVDSRTPQRLWQILRQQCLQAGDGCDVIAIPHNPNLSGGRMFPALEQLPLSYTRAEAAFRARIEPVLEIMQHKGDSECFYAPGDADELCEFEQLPYRLFSGKFFSRFATPPRPGDGYARPTLNEGLRVAAVVGANPYKLGFIGSTDTHLGTPGAVDEAVHLGHGGAGISASAELPKGLPDDIEYNPGGLAAVWAEENSRDAIFAAMRRREVYGTSGPRIRLRFFGGWNYEESLCRRGDAAKLAYAGGQPMGGELRGAAGAAPRFWFNAMRDPGVAGRPGGLLQRVQIVKGWLDDEGWPREKVFEAAGDPDNDADVDDQCRPIGRGFDQLCGVWRDPEFNAEQPAWYYTRVVQNPSCRWSARICDRIQVDCSRPDELPAEFQGCCDAEFPRIIQERAWSSPIWYSPK